MATCKRWQGLALATMGTLCGGLADADEVDVEKGLNRGGVAYTIGSWTGDGDTGEVVLSVLRTSYDGCGFDTGGTFYITQSAGTDYQLYDPADGISVNMTQLSDGRDDNALSGTYRIEVAADEWHILKLKRSGRFVAVGECMADSGGEPASPVEAFLSEHSGTPIPMYLDAGGGGVWEGHFDGAASYDMNLYGDTGNGQPGFSIAYDDATFTFRYDGINDDFEEAAHETNLYLDNYSTILQYESATGVWTLVRSNPNNPSDWVRLTSTP